MADVMEPMSQINSYILAPFTSLFRAIRVCEFNRIERKCYSARGTTKMDATVENKKGKLNVELLYAFCNVYILILVQIKQY